MRRLAGTVQLVGAVLFAVLLASPADAVDVREVDWGFDGNVVPQRVSLLSVLLANESGKAFDDTVTLRRKGGAAGRLGADLAVPCYMAPFTSRWVQFYPYVGSRADEWELLPGRGRAELPTPRLGAPGAVCLTDPDDPLQGRAGLPRFREDLFPVTVAATDGLAAVVMDHAPRWEGARRRAFLDWLRRGGALHLLPAQNGKYPQFGGDMRVLNDPADRFRIGSGLVVRHRAGRSEVNQKFLARAGYPLPEMESSNAGYMTLDEGLLASIKDLVRPHHNWLLIYVSLIAYVLLIGPVNYFMGRRAARFRRAIVFFLCTAALFGWAMGALGRRGFGETSSIHSLAYAVPIEGENYDVTQWVNVFVIHGGYYDLRHGDDNDVYATCESLEPVNGIIENGAGGRFYVDIPLFSNRPFLHRARMRGHALGLGVLEWRQKRGLEALTLSVGPGFPADLVEAWVLHGDRVLPMEREGDTLRLGSGRRWSLKEFLSEQRLGLSRLYVGVSANQSADPREAAKEMVPVLIARALGGTTDVSYGFTLPQPPDDEAQVFLLTKSPPDFALQGEGLGSESGYVLYHVRLHRPEDSDG